MNAQPDHIWLTSELVARYRGITDRGARKALKRGSLDGHDLIVRRAKGRGGPKGLRYEARLDSLPRELQARYGVSSPHQVLPVADAALPVPAPPAPVVPAVRGASGDWNWRLELIRPVIENTEPRSRARAEVIRTFARQHGVSETSVRRYIRDYEAEGIAGLERKTRADKGRRRALIGNAWDRAVPFDDAVKREIAAKLLRKVRSFWAAGAPGWRHIQRTATIYLAKLTRAAGLDLPEQELLELCTVPRAFICRERATYRAISRKRRDAKAWRDDQPHIRRDYADLEPLELVIGDVHPVDIYFLRPDGTVQPIRLIGWLDARTNRFVGHVLFPEKGTGVRMEHAATSYACMMFAWGVAKTLLLDNGGEYNVFELIRDAMALAKGHDDDLRTLIKALPHSPQSKKIEAIFRVLAYQFLSTIPGYQGGDRMRPKLATVGKAPRPFSGTREELNAAIQQQIAAYNATPQQGLGGLSPDQAWGKAIEAGWRPTVTDIGTLQVAFAREETRTVRQSEIRIDNRFYTHDELYARPHLEKVKVRLPVFGDARPAVYDLDGTFICHAQENAPYRALDVAGAREAWRRKRLKNGAAEALRADIDPVDFQADTAAFLAINPPPAPSKAAGRIGLAPEQARDAEGRRKLGPQERRDAEAAKLAERRRNSALLAKLAG